MSVTIYLTDHNGKQVAFFYRIDNERYSTCPNILWACRQYPQFQGTASSKGDFIEKAKQTLKEIKKLESVPKSVPVRKKCKECDTILQGRENEGETYDEHDFNR
jgi:hypothetical protein